MKKNNIKFRQDGTILLIALIFLAMTAMISSSVLNTSVLEAKMVGNAQFKEEAFQVVEGVLDAILADYENNLPVAGDLGHTICGLNDSDPECDMSIMNLPAEVISVAHGVNLRFRAERLGPLLAPLPFRQSEDEVSSSDFFDVAIYEVNAGYDGRDVRLGHHAVFEGVAIRVASSGQ